MSVSREARFVNCVLHANGADEGAGALYAIDTADLAVRNCTIHGNAVPLGVRPYATRVLHASAGS